MIPKNAYLCRRCTLSNSLVKLVYIQLMLSSHHYRNGSQIDRADQRLCRTIQNLEIAIEKLDQNGFCWLTIMCSEKCI
jgi:hypothetical protein